MENKNALNVIVYTLKNLEKIDMVNNGIDVIYAMQLFKISDVFLTI